MLDISNISLTISKLQPIMLHQAMVTAVEASRQGKILASVVEVSSILWNNERLPAEEGRLAFK